jgi:hypothetical protein
MSKKGFFRWLRQKSRNQNIKPKSDRDSTTQSEAAFKRLRSFGWFGLFAVTVYALQAPSWRQFVGVASTGVVVASASLVMGILLGFLFGIPRTPQQSPPPKTQSANTTDNSAPGETNETSGTSYQPNTNLEQISDWLTKILVGVGLTQVRAISEKLNQVAGGVAWVLGSPNGNRAFALALILTYLVLGFLYSYLWTRLYLAKAFRQADVEDQLKELGVQVAQANLTARDTQKASLGVGKATPGVVKSLLETSSHILPNDSNDPWKGRFGGKSVSNQRQLTAKVEPIPGNPDLYSVRLTVSSTDPDINPLRGVVQFFLHPTFNNDKPIISVGPTGRAELNLTAWGAFTVGALTDNGKTRLELDLAELEGAPAQFRSR